LAGPFNAGGSIPAISVSRSIHAGVSVWLDPG
jgi:hypothetical protein